MLRLVPKPGEKIKKYQMPFAVVYGLWLLLLERKGIN